MSAFTLCSSDDIVLSLFLTIIFNSLISLSNCSTSGVWELTTVVTEESVFERMFDVDVDP